MARPTSTFRGSGAVLVVTLVHSACIANSQERQGGAIVDGDPAPWSPEVGLLTVGPSACTATLVAPRVAIAAKHCVRPDTRPADVTLRFEGVLVFATGLFHEGPFSQGGGTPPADFLALSLDRDVEGIWPRVIRRAPLGRSLVGKPVTIVGYGKVSGEDGAESGERRIGVTEVQSVQDDTFRTGPSHDRAATTCQGDSGGPVLYDGAVIGVISGTYGRCESALHTRVDRFAHLVDQAVARAARGGSGPESCQLAGNGVCDVPASCEPGADALDCSNGCRWARDGVCDEPWVCAAGTDAADCAPSRARCRWAHDGACDEPYLCEPGTDEGDC